MRILIVSYFFEPEITPRAFRVAELARGFVKAGHSVEVILPNKAVYSTSDRAQGVQLTRCGLGKQESTNPEAQSVKSDTQAPEAAPRSKSSKWRFWAKGLKQYLLPKEIYSTYDHRITRELLGRKEEVDLIISVSHPLSIHLSTAIAMIFNPALKVKKSIIEFSDPPFKGDYCSVFPLYPLLMRCIMRRFDILFIPTAAALARYEGFVEDNRIKVVPQSIDLRAINLCTYKKHDVPTFAYAGRFYEGLRDPTFFLEHLCQIDSDFKFILYLSKNDPFIPLLRSCESQIAGSIVVRDHIERSALLSELSAFDFLVNFENEDSSMQPSKLIDYAAVRRPILSFNSKTFRPDVFHEFLTGEYINAIGLDPEEFDTSNVVRKILSYVD